MLLVVRRIRYRSCAEIGTRSFTENGEHAVPVDDFERYSTTATAARCRIATRSGTTLLTAKELAIILVNVY